MALLYFFKIFNRTIREEFNMKVTNEEKIIIQFLKKEMKEAKAYEEDVRKELIQGLENKPYDLTEFERYNDACYTYFVISGMYETYVDDIVTRFKHEIRFGKS